MLDLQGRDIRVSVLVVCIGCVISTPVILNGGYIYTKRAPILRIEALSVGFIGMCQKTYIMRFAFGPLVLPD